MPCEEVHAEIHKQSVALVLGEKARKRFSDLGFSSFPY